MNEHNVTLQQAETSLLASIFEMLRLQGKSNKPIQIGDGNVTINIAITINNTVTNSRATSMNVGGLERYGR